MFEQINKTLTSGLEASPLVNNRAGQLAEDVSHVRLAKNCVAVSRGRVEVVP